VTTTIKKEIMAINVNKVYKSVLSILNKEQRGFMTPDEFNKIAVQAQLNLLDLAFVEYNKMSNLDTVGRTNLGYADMPSKIKEKIDVFYKTSNLTMQTSGNPAVSTGIVALPSDIYKIIELTNSTRTLPFELVDKHDLAYLQSSPLTAPSTDYPIYYKTTTSAGATSIQVKPTSIANAVLDYIKVPVDPRFGFTLNATYGTQTYDSNVYSATGLVTGKTLATTTGYTTLGSGYNDDTYLLDFKGGTFRLTIANSNNLPSSLVVVTPGTGFAVGDTITFPTGLANEGGGSTLSGNSNIVYTVTADDIFENTTQGSTDFELHPSEEPMLIMQILAFAGVIIKDREITQLASQSIQSNANIKQQ
jgi:hypothetical protein|tara:strand:- start:2313 stop:3395 length:1083 start_codon:yes stop_codon:yes gene_type:complete